MNETKITLNDNMKKNLAYGYSGGEQVENWDLNRWHRVQEQSGAPPATWLNRFRLK